MSPLESSTETGPSATVTKHRQKVREHDMAAIVSVHDINLAFRFVDHFLMLKEGRVHLSALKEQVTAADIEEVYGVKVVVGAGDRYKIVIPLDETMERRML